MEIEKKQEEYFKINTDRIDGGSSISDGLDKPSCKYCDSISSESLIKATNKLNSFLSKFLNLKLSEFIQFVGPARHKPENLIRDIMTTQIPTLDLDTIYKKASKNIYDLSIAEFINYAQSTNNSPEALIKTFTIKYKKDDAKERTEFARIISDLMYTDHLKDISFFRNRGKLIAKLAFAEGKKMKVTAQGNKLVFSYLS